MIISINIYLLLKLTSIFNYDLNQFLLEKNVMNSEDITSQSLKCDKKIFLE